VYGEVDAPITGEIIKNIGLTTQLKHYPLVESVSPVLSAATYTIASLLSGATDVYLNSVRNFSMGDSITFIKDAITESAWILGWACCASRRNRRMKIAHWGRFRI
jgi:hypothetical protein